MDSTDRKKKQRPYSEYERQLLMQLVQSNIDVVENRKTDSITQKKKSEAWEDIASQFNNTENVSQTASAAQLKKLWQNLKTRLSLNPILLTKISEVQKCTGGGPALLERSSEDTMVHSIIPSIKEEIDSDIGLSSTSRLSHNDDSMYWQPKKEQMDFELHVVEEEDSTESFQEISSHHTVQPSNENGKIIDVSEDSRSLDDLRKELLKKQIEKLEQSIKQQEEKHKVELEILQFKRDMLSRELNHK